MMAYTQTDMAEIATARANMHGLLAQVFRVEPSEAFLENLRAPEFSGALEALGLSLEDFFNRAPLSQLVEDLAVEFSRLFIGPGSHISPHESMHVAARFGEPNMLWGPSTVAVKKFYEGTGLKLAKGFSGMPDHISAEMEFLQQLALKEVEVWNNGDHELGRNIQKIEKRFYDEHLSQWAATFLKKVIAAAQSPYYAHIAEIAVEFLEFDEQTLSELLESEISPRLTA